MARPDERTPCPSDLQPMWFNEIGARHSHAVGHAGASDHLGHSYVRVKGEGKDFPDPKRSQFIDQILEKLKRRNEPEQIPLKEAA